MWLRLGRMAGCVESTPTLPRTRLCADDICTDCGPVVLAARSIRATIDRWCQRDIPLVLRKPTFLLWGAGRGRVVWGPLVDVRCGIIRMHRPMRDQFVASPPSTLRTPLGTNCARHVARRGLCGARGRCPLPARILQPRTNAGVLTPAAQLASSSSTPAGPASAHKVAPWLGQRGYPLQVRTPVVGDHADVQPGRGDLPALAQAASHTDTHFKRSAPRPDGLLRRFHVAIYSVRDIGTYLAYKKYHLPVDIVSYKGYDIHVRLPGCRARAATAGLAP